MHADDEILAEAERFLREEVAPQASRLDADPEALRIALDGLCRRNLMALRRPAEYGGPAVSEVSFRSFQELVARSSGALAFLQTQHQSAVSLLSKSAPDALKERMLPHMADGGILMGIGFSQLRRSGPPMMTAQWVGEAVRLSGRVPWATGAGLYSHILVAGALTSGEAVFCITPFANRDEDSGRIELSAPMRLAAMESAQTVEMTFTDWVVPAEDVAFTKPAGWIHTNDLINITLQGFFALGCAQGSLDIVEANLQRKGGDDAKRAWRAIADEVAECRRRLHDAQSANAELTTPVKLDLRAWAIELAVRCAHAAIATTGGSANAVDHPAQRLYREALVFTVSAQTTAIMEATMTRLARLG